jgi:EmrB/QacA subfamily drug resistance transporter
MTAQPATFRLTFVALMLVILLAAIDSTILASALPSVVADLHGVKIIAWVSTSFVLAQLAVAPLYGKLGDAYGRKPVLQSAILVFLVGSTLCGLAQTMTELIAARALQGIGAGGLFVLVQAIIGEMVAPRDRPQYQSWFTAVFGVASVGGPLLGGILVQQLSWRWVFFVNLPVGLCAELVLARVLPASAARRTDALDWPGALLLAIALSSFAGLVTLGGTSWPWVSPASGGLLAAAILAGIACAAVERRAADPILPANILGHGVFRNGMVQTAVVGAVMIGVVTFTPLYFEVVKSRSPTAAGLLLAAMMVGILSAGTLSGRAIARTGRYRAFPIAGFVAMTVGLLALSRSDLATPLALTCVELAIVGCGLGLTMQLVVSVVQAAMPRAQIGTVTSALQVGRGIGSSLGPAILGAVFAARLGHATQAIAGGGVAAGAAGAYLHALRPVYLVGAALAAVGIPAALRMEEVALSATVDDPDARLGPAGESARAVAATATTGSPLDRSRA